MIKLLRIKFLTSTTTNRSGQKVKKITRFCQVDHLESSALKEGVGVGHRETWI